MYALSLGGAVFLWQLQKITQFLSKLFTVIAETLQQMYLSSDSQSQGFRQAIT